MRHRIKEYISQKTKVTHDGFLNTMMYYKLAQIATNMRVSIQIPDGTEVPTNIYGLSLAKSGFSKGMTMNILEELFLPFKQKFLELIMDYGKDSIVRKAEETARLNGIDQGEAFDQIMERINDLPKFEISFKECTDAGIKGLRQKLDYFGLGATSFELDEVGRNIKKFNEVIDVFLEVYDLGKTKPRLIRTDKNSDTSNIPNNLLMFGTPSDLINGGEEEILFFEKLESGMARRLLFSYVNGDHKPIKLTPEQEYQRMINESKMFNKTEFDEWIGSFADLKYVNKVIPFEEKAAIHYLTYWDKCKDIAESFPETQTIKKTEMEHRYWKAVKIAGIIAFIEKSDTCNVDHVEEAIEIVEESGKAIQKIIERPPAYERLAKFIMAHDGRLTQHDLSRELTFYKGVKSVKDEMITMAAAYAYTNGGVIKRKKVSDVEFFEGESLKQTSQDSIILSYSTDQTYNFDNVVGKWENLPNVITKTGLHYSAHHYKNGHRSNENALESFNLVILDVDDGISIEAVKSLMKDYKWIIATTKSHQVEKNGEVLDRFRMILPLRYEMKLNAEEYKKFMKQIFKWLPFGVDEATCDAARKFESYHGEIITNNGMFLDPIDFIENTEQNKKINSNYESYGPTRAIERWLLSRYEEVGRNNTLIKYALAMVDNGEEYITVERKVFGMNDRFEEPLSKQEIHDTILKTIGSKYE